jgi:hypothetical protein
MCAIFARIVGWLTGQDLDLVSTVLLPATSSLEEQRWRGRRGQRGRGRERERERERERCQN